ncbi:MAG: response regulator transcription factor [Pirellulales bacterium]|nr:response regulator transcription factor [Pirellulales bacterium]
MDTEPTVFVVDDDEQMRASVCALVRSMQTQVEPFSSAEEFLDIYSPARPGCLVADVRMPGMSGLELQEELLRREAPLPLVFLTAYARVPTTVRAVRNGAVTVVEKPYRDDDLWDAVRQGLAVDAARRHEYEHRQVLRRRLATLTPAERRVLEMIVEGRTNKAIARELDISVRTIEGRRREIFAKTQTSSVAALVRMVIDARVEAGT